nr:putative late blight resistance protein homolog R1A-4 [Ipomoea batatas]
MFANSCRWLSLYTHKFDYYVLLRRNNPRSIFFFNEDDEISVSFKFLRVLAFVPSSFLQRVPTRLQDLVFLRYLSVTEWFEGLDYVVLANRNLQTLVVSGKKSQFGAPTLLPCTIWELPQLQQLELDKSYVIDPPSMDKDNMLTLSWVYYRTGVYFKFPNIEKLKVCIFCSNSIILDNLEYLERLERLSISSFGCVVILRKPSMFPSQLKKLRLNGTNLSERDLKVIGMLSQLEVLKLENAFRGEVWKVQEELFVGLKFLLLEDKTLKQWMVSDGSFPCLRHLVLRFCYCLEEIPGVLLDILTLVSIELQWCCQPLISYAKLIQAYHSLTGIEQQTTLAPFSSSMKMMTYRNPIILDNLEYLERLERLSISVSSIGFVVTLPRPSMFPSQLKKLGLNGTNLSDRDLKVIGMLPQLEVLKLKNVFCLKAWEVEKGLFIQLKFLLLEDTTLNYWMVRDKSFPYLKHLVLRFCYGLEYIPHVVKYIRTLESIELQCCPRSLITSAKRIQEYKRYNGYGIVEVACIGEAGDSRSSENCLSTVSSCWVGELTNNPRSILFFNEDDDILVSFKLLRVLAFVPSSFFKKVPARLQDLVFLRYLSVTEWFEGLNYVVSTNRNLQTLVISGEESQFRAHASLPSVCYTHCRTRVYCRFPNIEKLEVFVFCINPFNLDNIDYLERLEILSISISFGRVVTLRKPSMLPSQLKKLRFNGTNLSERDLKLIGMLPHLEVLKLENVFRGEEWKVEKGLFVRLKFLLLEDKTLKQWMASDGSFPCLKHLVLRFCYCLEKMHFERKSKYLESIELQWCRPPLIDSAKRIQKQQRDKDGNYTFEVRSYLS